MFNYKKIREQSVKIVEQKRRIYELEELICPLNQHEFVEIDYEIVPDFCCGQVETYCMRKLKCRKCHKVVYDSDQFGTFRYKTVDEKQS